MVAYRPGESPDTYLARLGQASTVTNRPFALASYGATLPWSIRPRRGYIVRPRLDGSAEALFHFMWNPSDIQTGYSVNAQLGDPSQMSEAQLGEGMRGAMATGRSISFHILLDRVTEVAQRTQDDESLRGVQHDVEVFEKVIGIDIEGGPPLPVQVGVSFGPGGPFQPANHPLFLGRITGAGVTFSFFSGDMVPTRCNLSINMERDLISHTEYGDDPPVHSAMPSMNEQLTLLGEAPPRVSNPGSPVTERPEPGNWWWPWN